MTEKIFSGPELSNLLSAIGADNLKRSDSYLADFATDYRKLLSTTKHRENSTPTRIEKRPKKTSKLAFSKKINNRNPHIATLKRLGYKVDTIGGNGIIWHEIWKDGVLIKPFADHSDISILAQKINLPDTRVYTPRMLSAKKRRVKKHRVKNHTIMKLSHGQRACGAMKALKDSAPSKELKLAQGGV